MKITIDLQDPEIQRQLELAIDAKITAIAAERVDAAIQGVINTKLDRLTDQRLDSLVASALAAGVKEKLEKRPGWNSPSLIESTVKEIAATIVRNAVAKMP